MTYYKERAIAFRKINAIIEKSRENKIEINIDKLIFELTNQFEIGDKTIKKRIELIQRIENDFEIIDNNIIWR